MFALEVDTRHCLCCGICTDVCPPRAIAARPARAPGIEGCVTYDRLASPRNLERAAEAPDGYPYLAHPARCDGCGICVDECPVTVMRLLGTFGHGGEGEEAAGAASSPERSRLQPPVHRQNMARMFTVNSCSRTGWVTGSSFMSKRAMKPIFMFSRGVYQIDGVSFR